MTEEIKNSPIVELKDLTPEDESLNRENLAPEGPSVEPFNIHREQEKVRGIIAQGLVVLLSMIILFAFITLWLYIKNFSDLEKLLTIIFGPVIALVGTAIGYYFGGKSSYIGSAINGKDGEGG